MRHRAVLLIVVLALVLPLLAGCDAVIDRSLPEECGWEGACCWADDTCHEGLVCNTETSRCEVDPQAASDEAAPIDAATPETDSSEEAAALATVERAAVP